MAEATLILPVEHGQVIHTTCMCIMEGHSSLDHLPGLIRRIIEEEMWREFYCEPARETVSFKSFAELVTSPLPRGFETSIKRLKDLCQDDVKTRDAIDRATQGQHGGDHTSNCNNIPLAPAGTSKDKALRRLRKDRPDLHAKVMEGELSAHAAAVVAGFRKPTFTVVAGDPEAAARAIKKRYSGKDLKRLRDLL